MLELKNVSKYYSSNGVVALGLRNINLKLNVGEIIAITGDSGSGKSTLLNVITAVDTYEEGEIYFEGNETSYFNQDDMDDFRKNNVSFIFQNYNIIESYTVLQNVMLPLILRGKTQEEAKREAKDIIEKVGLTARIKNRGSKLSGGEKQRCVIARALANDSKILACDEPTGNLDSETGAEIIKLIQEVAKDKLVLIVTHNYEQVKDIVTRKIKITDGEVVEDIQLKKQEQVEEIISETKQFQIRNASLFGIVFQNLISTPKRTIFSSIVFLVISLFSLILCLMALQFSYEIGNEPNEFYGIVHPNALVAFDDLHRAIDKRKLERTEHNEIYYNPFYEDINYAYTVLLPAYGKVELFAKFTYHKLSYEIVYGKDYSKNISDQEMVYVVPSSYSKKQISDLKRCLNQVIYSNNNTWYASLAGRLVGIAISEEITTPYFQCKEFPKETLNSILNAHTYGYYTTDGENKMPLRKITYYSSSKTYINCPLSYKDNFEYEFLLEDLYPANYSLEVVYEDGVADTPVLVLASDYIYGSFGPEFSEVYEATIYANNPRKVKESLEKQGIDVSIPSRIESRQINIIVLYLFIAIILFSLVILFFVSYIILSRIYASKTKEYGILRTLGLVKKKLGWIVILENLFLGLIASIFGICLFCIVDAIYPIMSLKQYMSPLVIFAYFLIVILFTLLIARRFNKRLFKFSVNTTLKGEVARND